MTDFLRGLLTPVRGLVFMARHKELLAHALVPFLVNLLLTGLVFAGLAAAGTALLDAYWEAFGGDWWGWALRVLAVVGTVAVLAALTAVAYVLLNGAVCGYFYGRLARRVELLLGARDEDLVEVSLGQEVRDTLRAVAKLVGITLLCLLFYLVPVLGPLLALAASWYFDTWIVGAEFMDYPLALRGQALVQRRERLEPHRWEVIGLGTTILVILLIPILNAVVLTCAVVGAVLLLRDWERAEGTGLAAPRPDAGEEGVDDS